MSLARFFPEFRALANIEEFNDPFFRSAGRRMPAMDLQETQDAYLIKADVPGFPKDKIEIDAHGSTLTIKGHYEESKEDKDTHHHSKERTQSSFQRSVTLPIDIPADKIAANLDHGVLSVKIPKVQAQPRKITIN